MHLGLITRDDRARPFRQLKIKESTNIFKNFLPAQAFFLKDTTTGDRILTNSSSLRYILASGRGFINFDFSTNQDNPIFTMSGDPLFDSVTSIQEHGAVKLYWL
jgi:hypothetical protein